MIEAGLAPEIEIDILLDAGDWRATLPFAQDIASAAAEAALRDAAVMTGAGAAIELSILLTDNAAIAELNSQWRGKAGPTNVLSFPADSDAGSPGLPVGAPVLLGDVAVALETLTAEAGDAGIAPEDHLRHLVVHGVLHLCGYDHENDADADRMESREIVILKALGVSDPYAAAERRLENARP
ncbi:MAG: putative rRNA maturation factor [Paracoccaceae bacterium]